MRRNKIFLVNFHLVLMMEDEARLLESFQKSDFISICVFIQEMEQRK